MRAITAWLVLTAALSSPGWAQQWELPLIDAKGDTMYTQLDAITQLTPTVYRAWSKYVYAKPANGDAGALVQKDYDCENGARRVVFAVFYDVDRHGTWRTDQPGRWIPVTRERGYEQWAAVCARVRWGALADLMLWLERELS